MPEIQINGTLPGTIHHKSHDMQKKCWVIFLIILPCSVLAQFNQKKEDSLLNAVIKNECDGAEFTKTEVLPRLTVSNTAYADSLMTFLHDKETPKRNGKVACYFLFDKTVANI